MSRITDIFKNQKAFIPFVTAGDPSLAVTERLIPAMALAGADLIEIGIPFSDPVAEGLVIQEADSRALLGGFTTDKLFESIKRIRKKTDVPLALMTYLNPIFVYGGKRFAMEAAKCGIDALIVPDMPFEEKQELLPVCQQYGLTIISLVAPTSRERITRIAADAQGFLYCVSSLGVTGVRTEITTDLREMVSLAKKAKDIPCAIGFGISTPAQARQMAALADGVIVGSAIVKLVAQYKDRCLEPVCEYITAMKEAISFTP